MWAVLVHCSGQWVRIELTAPRNWPCIINVYQMHNDQRVTNYTTLSGVWTLFDVLNAPLFTFLNFNLKDFIVVAAKTAFFKIIICAFVFWFRLQKVVLKKYQSSGLEPDTRMTSKDPRINHCILLHCQIEPFDAVAHTTHLPAVSAQTDNPAANYT